MTVENSQQAKQVTLVKLLSGPQMGAEVRLADGEYLVGGSDECDIVLLDESVASRHVTLVLREGVARVRVRERKVALGERLIPPGEEIEVPVGAAIGLGTTYLAVGPEGTDWLETLLPEALGRRSGQTEEEPEAVAEMMPQAGEPELPAQAAGSELKRRGAGWAAVAVLLITGAWLMLHHDPYGWMDSSASESPVAAGPSNMDQTREILDELGLHSIRPRLRADGTVVIQGYCPTEQGKRLLTQALRAARIRFENRLRPEDALRRTLEDTLDRLGASALNYEYQGGGGVRLDGYAPLEIVREELLAIVQNDVPAIGRVDGGWRTLGDAVAELRGRVRAVGLQEAVIADIEGASIAVRGKLGEAQMALWQKVAGDFTRATGSAPPLESRVRLRDDIRRAVDTRSAVSPADEPEAISAVSMDTDLAGPPTHISVQGVLVGVDGDGPSAAVLADGAIVKEGDPIDGSHVVRKIEFDRVVVGDGSRQYVFYVGES
ncbi:MAG: EscD/YscD/HrpQ family type III secretion system inner membrane ring protein [Sulfitobacter sp.]|nr:EscD/YscD/HrpQ family type III secretion system inner membrane ring protein [Sulfitobacter sp.]